MAKKMPMLSIIVPNSEPKGYEGSYQDHRDDHVGAARRGISADDYEDSARDRVADKAGEKHFKDKNADRADIKESSSYKKGVSAFNNSPKAAHGFGHKAEHKQGHLRNSGSSGAHRIGKRK